MSMALFSVGAGCTAGALEFLRLRPETMPWRELTVGFALQGVVVLALTCAGLPESLRYLDYRGSDWWSKGVPECTKRHKVKINVEKGSNASLVGAIVMSTLLAGLLAMVISPDACRHARKHAYTHPRTLLSRYSCAAPCGAQIRVPSVEKCRLH